MVEYIDKAKVKRAVRRYCKDKLDKGAYRLDTCDTNADIQLIISGILPAADVVPVVRCKDCKHSQNMPLGMCYLHTEPCTNEKGYKGEAVCVEPNDFCSYGERKADE